MPRNGGVGQLTSNSIVSFEKSHVELLLVPKGTVRQITRAAKGG